MRDLSYNYGLTIFDIRDYFTSSYIEEYESLILRAREEFNNILKNCYVPPYLPRLSIDSNLYNDAFCHISESND